MTATADVSCNFRGLKEEEILGRLFSHAEAELFQF
jgi:hypothetical protein